MKFPAKYVSRLSLPTDKPKWEYARNPQPKGAQHE